MAMLGGCLDELGVDLIGIINVNSNRNHNTNIDTNTTHAHTNAININVASTNITNATLASWWRKRCRINSRRTQSLVVHVSYHTTHHEP